MARSLVIVESPAKARTINRYLGKDYIVKSSVGHIRELPTGGKASDPKARAKEAGKKRKTSATAKGAYRKKRARATRAAQGRRPRPQRSRDLRDSPGQGKGRRRAETACREIRPDLSRDGPRPRRRSDRVAPERDDRRRSRSVSACRVQRDHAQ